MKARQETAVSRARNWRHTHQVFQPYGKVVTKMVSLQRHNSAQHSDIATHVNGSARSSLQITFLTQTHILCNFNAKTTQRKDVFCRLPYDRSSTSPNRVLHTVRPIDSSRTFQRPLVSLKFAQKIDNGLRQCDGRPSGFYSLWSSSSCFRLLLRLPVTSILPFLSFFQ